VWCFDYSLNKREIVKNLCLIIPILLIYFYLRNIAVSENNLLIYITNINIYLKNIFFGLSLYFYQLIFLDIYIISHQDQFNFLYFLVAFSTALFIIIYLYKNFSNKKYFIWCILFLILFLFPTFLLEDYSVLNHRIIIPISAIVMIATMFIEQIINIKYIKHILIFLFCFLFIYCFYYSSLLQYKYKNEINFKVNAYIDAPNYHPTCYWMARLYIQQEEFEKAKDFLQKANFYGNNRYLSDLALIYYCEGNMDKAEELYNKSIEYGINKAQCYRNLSVIYLKRDNDIDKAIEYAKLAVQKEPYDDGYKQYLQRLIDEKNNF
jgi:tetratricopeptide (TPR) repeat protein